MKTFNIQGRPVGYNHKPLVIAELGINHNGSLALAKTMVDAAARAGVEVLKHQTHIVEDEMSQEAKKVVPGNAEISIYDIMADCALSRDDEYELMKYVQSKGMIFISTPFSRAAAVRLMEFEVPAFKIGSGECNNFPLIEHVARYGKPVILSTGMNSLTTIRKSVAILEKHAVPFALMHTTNLYPTPPHLVRLGALQQMIDAFPDIPVGLSDHTLSNHACLGAVAMGASLLERHFTDNMYRTGPDIACSMDEVACKELIVGANLLAQMRGGNKEASTEEKVTMDFAFATVVTIAPVKKGEKFTKDNLWVKRPGTGALLAEHYEKVLGCIATRDIAADKHISWDDVADNSDSK